MVLRQVKGVIRNLDVSGDSIKIDRANLKVIRNLEDKLRRIVISPAYRKKLEKFIAAFDKVRGINDGYFLSLIPKYNPAKQVFGAIISSSIDSTQGSLLRAGIDQAIIKPVTDLIRQAITSGMFKGS